MPRRETWYPETQALSFSLGNSIPQYYTKGLYVCIFSTVMHTILWQEIKYFIIYLYRTHNIMWEIYLL